MLKKKKSGSIIQLRQILLSNYAYHFNAQYIVSYMGKKKYQDACIILEVEKEKKIVVQWGGYKFHDLYIKFSLQERTYMFYNAGSYLAE